MTDSKSWPYSTCCVTAIPYPRDIHATTHHWSLICHDTRTQYSSSQTKRRVEASWPRGTVDTHRSSTSEDRQPKYPWRTFASRSAAPLSFWPFFFIPTSLILVPARPSGLLGSCKRGRKDGGATSGQNMATANTNAAPGATRPVDQHVEFVVKVIFYCRRSNICLSLAPCGSRSDRSCPFSTPLSVLGLFLGSLARAYTAAWFPFPVEALNSGSVVVEYTFLIAPAAWYSFQLLQKTKSNCQHWFPPYICILSPPSWTSACSHKQTNLTSRVPHCL